MPKIRVALCIAELLAGGAEKALTWLAIRLDRTRFEPVVYVLRSRNYHDGKPSFISVLEEHDVPVQFLDLNGFFSLFRAVSHLGRELRTQKADILLSFMFHANILGRIAARRAGVSTVLSGIRVSEREHKSHIFIDRFTSSLVDRYICVSRSAAEFTEKTGKISPDKIVVIPNGVTNISLLPPPETPLPSPFIGDRTKRILFVGRLAHQKGLDAILPNAGTWLGNETGKEWSLWLAGNGPQEDELRKIVRTLPPETAARIHFTGWRPDISQLLASSDLLLLPSRYEGMPNILLEASLAGIPVLSSRCDGAEEILGENGAEQLFRFGNQDEFQQKISRLMSDNVLRRELGEKNKLRTQKEFSIEKAAAAYESLFESMLRRTK